MFYFTEGLTGLLKWTGFAWIRALDLLQAERKGGRNDFCKLKLFHDVSGIDHCKLPVLYDVVFSSLQRLCELSELNHFVNGHSCVRNFETETC